MSAHKILLVDDERDILDLLEYNLKKVGYEVYTAQNGRIGLEKAKIILPDLIILDYMMPEMDGIETCLNLRQEPCLSRTQIVMLSARIESDVVRTAFKHGANDYIAKPITPSLFLNKVNHLLAS